MDTTRRSLITGLIALVAAPAIVRAGSLMPVKVMAESPWSLVRGPGYLYSEELGPAVAHWSEQPFYGMVDGRIFWISGDGDLFMDAVDCRLTSDAVA